MTAAIEKRLIWIMDDRFKEEMEARVLMLEASQIQHQAWLETLQEILIGYLEAQDATFEDEAGKPFSIREHKNALLKERLRDVLAHMADADPGRASKIASILKINES